MAGPPGPRPFLACAGRILLELFDDDSDDDLILEFIDDEPDERPKRQDFFEDVIPCMTPSDFKFHFRLSRETVAKVLNMVHPRIASQKVAPGRPMVDPLKQTMVALWCLGNRESFRAIADRFELSKSTVFECVGRVGAAVVDASPDFIKWPDPEAAKSIIAGFEARSGFPGVIGAIGRSHIPIRCPVDDSERYRNRLDFHSVVLQAVCDHRMVFLDCSAGHPGSTSDMLVFRRSLFIQSLEASKFPFDSHMVGDATFPIGPHLMVPFEDDGELGEEETSFNEKIFDGCETIERALALLKGRFRRLQGLETGRRDLVVTIIIMACVLHNACIMWDDLLEEFKVYSRSLDNDDGDDLVDVDEIRQGVVKRRKLASALARRR
ncbi:unnamed protein product [Ixodes pacificus]